MTILNSLIVSVSKNLKGGTLRDFQTSIMFQNIKKKLKGDPLVQSKIFRKKSHSAEKKQVKNTQIAKVGILSCFKVLDVGFIILDEVLRFAVCLGQTEQMNKKVDLTRVKKTTHCKSRADFLLKCAD